MFSLPHVPNSNELIDKAFRRGSKKAKSTRSVKGQRHNRLIRSEIVRVNTIGNIIEHKLNSIVKKFPSYEQLTPFYQTLFDLKIDKNKYKKSIGAVNGALRVCKKLRRETVKEIKTNLDTNASRRYLGRISTLIKKISSSLNELIEIREILRSFPVVEDIPTLVIAGYPNVGKSTFTRNLTGSKIRVACYPFTTTEILIGHTNIGYRRYQIIDTPGLLDRSMEKRNKTEMKAILAINELADKVLFLIDPLQDLEKQYRLLSEIKENIHLDIYTAINKVDIATDNHISNAKKKFKSEDLICANKKEDCRNLFKKIFTINT